jgi:hypothetical protein
VIKYRKGYKYQLHRDTKQQTNIFPINDIDTTFIKLEEHGLLTVKTGYAWDGASGPTIDTKSAMRGSLIHDALYQLMREQLISSFNNRKRADQIFMDILREDGMGKFRSWMWYNAVRIGAKRSSVIGREVHTAP